MSICQWEVDVLDVRQELRIVVLEAEQYDPSFPPTNLIDFTAWFNETIAKIPMEFRATTSIEFSSVESYYDSHYGNIEITYTRPETDQEWDARKEDVLSRLALAQRQREENERSIYEALRRKYEEPKP